MISVSVFSYALGVFFNEHATPRVASMTHLGENMLIRGV